MPFNNINTLNQGPVVYFFGHGRVCSDLSARVMSLGTVDCISMIDDLDTKGGGGSLSMESHINVLRQLVDFANFVVLKPGQILINYLKEAIDISKVSYVRYISSRFDHDSEEEYLIGGHDLQTLNRRVALMRDHTLTSKLKKQIIDYQEQYMPVVEQKGVTYSREIRERLVTPPYGIFGELFTESAGLPIDPEYIRVPHVVTFNNSSYKIMMLLNKKALRVDIAELHDVPMVISYTEFSESRFKYKLLSGKNFLFVYINYLENLSLPEIAISELLLPFISRLHLVIEKDRENELLPEYINLYSSDELGETILPEELSSEFDYYDLAMPQNPTLVLGACSGNDTVLKSIFKENTPSTCFSNVMHRIIGLSSINQQITEETPSNEEFHAEMFPVVPAVEQRDAMNTTSETSVEGGDRLEQEDEVVIHSMLSGDSQDYCDHIGKLS